MPQYTVCNPANTNLSLVNLIYLGDLLRGIVYTSEALLKRLHGTIRN